MKNPFKDHTGCDCLTLAEDTQKRQEFYTKEIMALLSELDAKLDTYITEIQTLKATVAEQANNIATLQGELANPPLPDSTNQKLATLDALSTQ